MAGLSAGQDAATPAIRFAGVGKVYGDGREALRGLSFVVDAGEFVSVLGPSGCGKSTALRMMAGLSAPSSGTIAMGQPGAPEPKTGFVFQEPTLLPWATVFDNVRLPLRLHGTGRAESAPRVTEALAAVGLTEFAEVRPHQLSGGMKMRASIARALVAEPRLLLLDEPFAALDEITRFRLNDDLLALWQRQRWTVVFVTHSVFEAVFLSQRILVMSPRPGHVAAEIAVDEPFPRGEEFRGTAHYAELCRRTSLALAAAGAGGLA